MGQTQYLPPGDQDSTPVYYKLSKSAVREVTELMDRVLFVPKPNQSVTNFPH